MKKWSIWILAIVLVLGIGFSALAEEADIGLDFCWPRPATCKGNLVEPLAKGMGVTLHVVPYAKLELNDMDISFCQPGKDLRGQILVPFTGGANTKINLNIQSEGFEPARANDWITYHVGGLSWTERTLRPGGRSVSFTREAGRWFGLIRASGEWKDGPFHDWTRYLADDYTDTIVFTVSKAG